MLSDSYKFNALIIVDDSSFDLKISSRIAQHTQLFKEIYCFASGGEALDFIIANLDNAALYPQLIFLDIQMPDMDGFEFMSRYNRLPDSYKASSDVIMLSSTDDLKDIAKADSDGNITALLRKPLQIDKLKQEIEQIFNT